MKILILSTYYQLLFFIRLKQSLFFSVTFPVFIFILFGTIWRESLEYIPFLLSGVIGMTVMSDGLFSIGSVIKIYYKNNVIKYLRKMPFSILLHFGGLIISRMISLLVVIVLLSISAKFIFDYTVSLNEFLNYLMGLFVGLFIFSFIGLIISFSNIKQDGKGLINIVYFLILFTSNAFYPTDRINESLSSVTNLLPLNDILLIMREGSFSLSLIYWIIIPVIIFYVMFKKVQIHR